MSKPMIFSIIIGAQWKLDSGHEGKWTDTHGNPLTYSNWKTGKIYFNHGCVQIDSNNGLWTNLDCDRGHIWAFNFACQYGKKTQIVSCPNLNCQLHLKTFQDVFH